MNTSKSDQINDFRSDDDRALNSGFLVGTDKAMSGWGQAPGRSRVAVVIGDRNPQRLEDTMRDSGIRRIAYQATLNATINRLRDGDHLSIYGTNSYR